jgi:hypothetical protein
MCLDFSGLTYVNILLLYFATATNCFYVNSSSFPLQISVRHNTKRLSDWVCASKIYFVTKDILKFSLFGDVPLRRFLVCNRRFGAKYLSHLQGSDNTCPEMSVTKYQPTPRKVLGNRRPQLCRGGSLKYRTKFLDRNVLWKAYALLPA